MPSARAARPGDRAAGVPSTRRIQHGKTASRWSPSDSTQARVSCKCSSVSPGRPIMRLAMGKNLARHSRRSCRAQKSPQAARLSRPILPVAARPAEQLAGGRFHAHVHPHVAAAIAARQQVVERFELPVVVLGHAGHVGVIDLDHADLRNAADLASTSAISASGSDLHAVGPVAEEILARARRCCPGRQRRLVSTSAKMVSGGRCTMGTRAIVQNEQPRPQPRLSFHHAHGAGPANRRNRHRRAASRRAPPRARALAAGGCGRWRPRSVSA